MEVWGGAVPDSVMRYLGESPWSRLEKIRDGVAGASRLTALSRGRNLFGYNPYPDSVIEGFCTNAVRSGVDVMRIFDALNDIDNMTSSIDAVKKAGGLADCAVCYTTDPHFTRGERFSAFLKGRKLPREIFTTRYFVDKAKELARRGADMISIKDMAGLVEPAAAADLVKAIKDAVSLPLDFHTHCTPGFGVASVLMAMVSGVDIVDSVVLGFSGGPAAPAFEIVQLFAASLGLDTGVDLAAVSALDSELRTIRAELDKFDQMKRVPPVFDISSGKIPASLEGLVADAVEAAKAGRIDAVLGVCQDIEKWFNYPEPDGIVKRAQIPGGMYTNMLQQLKEAKLEQHMDEVLRSVPLVRLDAGVPPLVTPTSQIVGVQAVNCVIDRTQGKSWYTNVSKNFIELVKGSYGRTPWPVDPAFRERIAGVRDEVAYDTSKYKVQPNPELPGFGGVRLALDEREQLLLELFPSVADKFLRAEREKEWKAKLAALPPERDPDEGRRFPPRFWEEELQAAIEA
jgi:oxaloacetate decarboxylase alpha subunit/pyruvate carboxylase subunit B